MPPRGAPAPLPGVPGALCSVLAAVAAPEVPPVAVPSALPELPEVTVTPTALCLPTPTAA